MSKIYFATIDNDIIDSTQLEHVAKIVTGNNFDTDSISEFASICKGIVREIKRPSVKFLLKNGHKISAIKVYRDTHDGVSLKDAMEAVNKIKKEMKL